MGIVRAQRRVQQGSARAQFGAAEGPPALPATERAKQTARRGV